MILIFELIRKFCQSQVLRWEAIIHNYLKGDKMIPTLHRQHNEIQFNPNGFKMLSLLISPCHPAYAENGILIQPHSTGQAYAGFCHCGFYCCSQCAYLNAVHSWNDDIHVIHFLDWCRHAGILCTRYNQKKQVPDCQYKFT